VHRLFEETKLQALSSAESQALDDESLAYDQNSSERRSSRGSAHPAVVQTATTLRIRNSKVFLMDGPSLREQIGNFILIEARDLNEAIPIASKISSIRLGMR
jgi:hypothetical protein